MNPDLRDRHWGHRPDPHAPPCGHRLITRSDAEILGRMRSPEQMVREPVLDVHAYMHCDRGCGPARAASAFYYRALERGLFDNDCAFAIQEKYDGDLVMWDGARLLQKSGMPLKGRWLERLREHTKELLLRAAGVALVGELHVGRGRRRFLRTVLAGHPVSEGGVELHPRIDVFDVLGLAQTTYEDRLAALRGLRLNGPHVGVAHTATVATMAEAAAAFKGIVYTNHETMAEGVILRRMDSVYRTGVTRAMIKIKPIVLLAAVPTMKPHIPDPFHMDVDGAEEDGNAGDAFAICSAPLSAPRPTFQASRLQTADLRQRIMTRGGYARSGLVSNELPLNAPMGLRSIRIACAPSDPNRTMQATLRFFKSCDQFEAEHRAMGLYDIYSVGPRAPIHAWAHMYELATGWARLGGGRYGSCLRPDAPGRLTETVLYIAGHSDLALKRYRHTRPRRAIPVEEGRPLSGIRRLYPDGADWWPEAVAVAPHPRIVLSRARPEGVRPRGRRMAQGDSNGRFLVFLSLLLVFEPDLLDRFNDTATYTVNRGGSIELGGLRNDPVLLAGFRRMVQSVATAQAHHATVTSSVYFRTCSIRPDRGEQLGIFAHGKDPGWMAWLDAWESAYNQYVRPQIIQNSGPGTRRMLTIREATMAFRRDTRDWSGRHTHRAILERLSQALAREFQAARLLQSIGKAARLLQSTRLYSVGEALVGRMQNSRYTDPLDDDIDPREGIDQDILRRDTKASLVLPGLYILVCGSDCRRPLRYGWTAAEGRRNVFHRMGFPWGQLPRSADTLLDVDAHSNPDWLGRMGLRLDTDTAFIFHGTVAPLVVYGNPALSRAGFEPIRLAVRVHDNTVTEILFRSTQADAGMRTSAMVPIVTNLLDSILRVEGPSPGADYSVLNLAQIRQ